MNTSENIAYLKYFGLDITFWKTLNRLFCGSTSKLAWKIHDINNEKIEEYLKKTCPCTYEKLKKGEYDEPKTLEDTYINPNVKPNDVIWTMWWQGEENAPFLVKECINSMRLHGNGHQVVVLSKNNYKEYVRIPKYIEDRFHEGENDNSALKKTVLGNTHLSDIIRTQLLYLYGGIWADATMMFSGSLEENAFFKDCPHPDAMISNNLFIESYFTHSLKHSITYSKSSSVILVFRGRVISFSNMWKAFWKSLMSKPNFL